MAADQEDKRTADEKKLFELIEKGSNTNDAVVAHVKASKVKIDCLDPKGMTPLQLAAFRGNKQLCDFLLANGADVNSNYHENSYSALMFAALSGNPEVTRQMLEAGANVNHINSVNRTAAQMAAFVGQHQCVSVINNFFPREEIDYFTRPQGLEKEAKLPKSVAPALCRLINFSNLHPVRRLIRQSLKDFPYTSSALLQQMVRQIAPVKIVRLLMGLEYV
ncbi:ankyrin repeat and MYND domain-containing protein 2 [Elysia marginata]|uniref:Ankyrin repeat and MYND domain-containing protein 2 n=1 Tax=Elysia marginata TaxID=1093978 RepID=A0AAV4JSI4_9GAST|nr:ankyrin repeat and MYND domain-containing protein 2 [Elysia marginata]